MAAPIKSEKSVINLMSKVYERRTGPLSSSLINEFSGIVGPKNILANDVDRLLYSYDAAMDRAVPSCVLLPLTSAEIANIVKICRRESIPFVARGAGTNLCGGVIPLNNAVVIAPTRMNKILNIDQSKRTATVEPGLPNLFLNKTLESTGLYYAPDPASQKACTIGGNVGTNAGGPHCLKYGVTAQHVLGLEVVMPNGEIEEFDLAQAGYDLTGFFVGSEGTLGIVTRVTLNLLKVPERVETMLVSFQSLEEAMQTVTDIVAFGIIPATLEAMDKITVAAVESFIHAGYPLDAEAVLLIEVDGSQEVERQVSDIKRICEKNGSGEFRLARSAAEREKLWEGRRGSYPSLARLAPNVLVEDGVVPRNRLPEAVKKIRDVAQSYGLRLSLIFHAGDGNLHPQLLFDERDQEVYHKVKKAGHEMLKVCVDLGGSISGEHGVGMDKRNAMKWLFTPETLQQFRKIKETFDPNNLSNPDKLIPQAPSQYEPQNIVLAPLPKEKEVSPSTPEEFRALLAAIDAAHKKLEFRGAGTHRGSSSNSDYVLSTLKLKSVVDHDVDNFTITVQGGITVEALENFLRKSSQKTLLLSEGTVGGLLSRNPACAPRLRDQILGMKVIRADGQVLLFGGKVMKNVAGYDAAKLFLGAMGSLGLILEVTLRTFSEKYCQTVDLLAKTPTLALSPSGFELRRKIKQAFDPANTLLEPEWMRMN